ncbi:MAG: GIN domain-containing protein [Candidatus Cryptobacteroides sp.]
MKRLVLPIILAAAASLASCSHRIVESGNVITREYSISPEFNTIDISSGLHVVVDQSFVAGKIEVTASDNIHQFLDIYVTDGILNVGMASGFSYSEISVTVRVSAMSVQALYASGGSSVICEGNLMTPRLHLALSGGSTISLRGTAPSVSSSLSGGSRAEMMDFVAVALDAELSGGSVMSISVLDRLALDASGGSVFYYKGNPGEKSVNVSGGSECIQVK